MGQKAPVQRGAMAAAAMYSIYTKEVEHLAPGTTDHEVSGVGGSGLTYNTQGPEPKTTTNRNLQTVQLLCNASARSFLYTRKVVVPS